MATVFLATDEVLGREVALKQLPAQMYSEKELTERFRQEARALASLNHPNVVQIFDFFDHEEQLWIAMEFVRGGDLAGQMDTRGAFSPREAFEVILPVASGLAAAHARGIVHRDIKPMNILISEDLVPKLTDFGLAKLIETSVHTVAGVAMGSPPYMSPEQAAGRVADKATDMYSLGITLYELLSTRTPFEGDMSQVMAQHITQPPPPLTDLCPDLAPEISELVDSMLEKDPNLRLSDMNRLVSRAEALGVLNGA
jgi:serine/threonine-protein kinase